MCIAKFIRSVMVIGLVITLSVPVAAQEQETASSVIQEPEAAGSTEEFTLETLTVEAQKREEDIQEVPLSITGLSDVRLDESRIYDFNSLGLAVPNLSFRDFGNRAGFGFLSIRGLVSSRLAQDPTVGIYIDDIPITDFVSLSSPLLFNLQQAEVLRGPQSTLWGLNTEAGALLFYTRDPGDEWSASLKGEAGTDNFLLGQGAMGGPIVDGILRLGLDVAADTTEGDIKNIFDGSSANRTDTFGLRSKLIWTPADDLEVRLSLLADSITAGETFLQLPLDRDAYEEFVGLEIDEFEVALNDTGNTTRDSNTQSLRIQYETDWFDIVSITSRRWVDSDARSFDGDELPIPIDLSPLFGAPLGSTAPNCVWFRRITTICPSNGSPGYSSLISRISPKVKSCFPA